MDAVKVEEVIIGLLAEDLGVSPAEMRADLLASGSMLPVDSLLLVEIIVRLEDRFGVQVPETPEMAKTMTSVREFAAAIAHFMGSVENEATAPKPESLV